MKVLRPVLLNLPSRIYRTGVSELIILMYQLETVK